MTTDSGIETAANSGIETADGAPPAEQVRYRCVACGNLTRFDVVTLRRTKAFHHYSVGGVLTLEEEAVLDETVEEVSCRWCGHGNAVETVAESDAVAMAEAGAPDPE